MSLPPPPYAAPRPPKPRPRKRWWFIGATLLLAAVVVFGVGLWQTLAGATRTDAVVRVSSTPSTVEVEPGERRMIYLPQESTGATCSLTDADGQELVVASSFASTTVTTGGRTWRGVGSFTSSTAEVTLECTAGDPATDVRIGAPLGAGFVGGLLVTILAPLVLGLAGLAVLITTTLLWVTRKPQPGGSPGPASPPPPAR